MKRSGPSAILAVCAVVLLGLSLARLLDAVAKRALLTTRAELAETWRELDSARQALARKKARLLLDRQLLEHRLAAMARDEPHLVIDRRRRRLQLVLGDKVMLEAKFEVRGPAQGVEDFYAMPRSTLTLLGKRERTDWYRPDRLYRLEGLSPPADSADRLVERAFGPAELFLGAGITIHGRVSPEVPAEAVDHTYIQLDDHSLQALVKAVEPGALVFIH